MNTLKLNSILSIIYLGLILSTVSCSDDNEDENPYLKSLYKIDAVKTDNELFTFELYGETETLHMGYNKIYLRAINSDDNPVSSVQWRVLPLTALFASCPVEQPEYHSTGLYSGAIVFTDTVEWSLQIDGLINNIDGIAEIDVLPTGTEYSQLEDLNWQAQVFYISLVSPKNPVQGSNTLEACISRKISQLDYISVDSFTVKATVYPTSDSTDHTQYDLIHSTMGHYAGLIDLGSPGLWSIKLLIIDNTDTIPEQPVFSIVVP